MSVRQVSKYRDSRSRTSSASRVSESVVNPTRSANSSETSRRSAVAAGCRVRPPGSRTEVVERPVAEFPPRAVPHSPQNLWPGGFAAPHEEQVMARAVPHSPQNFWPAGFSAPHFEQPTHTPPGIELGTAASKPPDPHVRADPEIGTVPLRQ